MAKSMWIDEARVMAQECFAVGGDGVRGGGLRAPFQTVEAVAERIAAWMDTAAQNQRNTDYYSGLLDECAKHLGPEVYESDDRSVQEDPIRAKVPELVESLASEYLKAKEYSEHLRDMLMQCGRYLEPESCEYGNGVTAYEPLIERVPELVERLVKEAKP